MPKEKVEPTKKEQTQDRIKITQLPISFNPLRVIKNFPIQQPHRQLFVKLID